MASSPTDRGFTVRPFRPDDFPTVVAAAAQTAWDHLSPGEQALTAREEVARRAYHQTAGALSSPGSACFVGEDEGRLVAYDILMVRPDEVSGITEGLKLDGWVHPAYRGRGLNARMHQVIEDWCRQMGVRRLVAMVATHNHASLSATDKVGFETVRVLRAKWL